MLAAADPHARIAVLERQVAELRRRVADLEARIEARSPEPLQRVNDRRQAEAHRLEEAIAAILSEQSEPHELTAKDVGRALERRGFDRLPAERTLRLHLAAVRGNGNTL